MSSSNLVSIAAIEEIEYGVTPPTGEFKTARYVSESLSGTPQTTKSSEIHADRMSSGQVQTGLDVNGDIDMELSADPLLQDFVRGAMMNKTISKPAEVSGQAIVVDPIGKKLTFDLPHEFIVGELIFLSGFAEDKNNGMASVVSIDSTTSIIIAKETIASETSATTATVTRPSKLTIGTDIISFSICKHFTDLTDKSLSYLGMIVNQMSIQMNYGAIAKANFGFMGNGYDSPDTPLTLDRVVTEASTCQPLNATSDIGTVFIDGQVAKFCIQNLNIQLNNGLTPQQCMGRLAPRKYALGMATVNVSGSAYLADENWDMIEKKLTQEPISIAYSAHNKDGGIAVMVHGAQLSFPDASAKGLDQQSSIEFTGTAKKVDQGYFDIYFF